MVTWGDDQTAKAKPPRPTLYYNVSRQKNPDSYLVKMLFPAWETGAPTIRSFNRLDVSSSGGLESLKFTDWFDDKSAQPSNLSGPRNRYLELVLPALSYGSIQDLTQILLQTFIDTEFVGKPLSRFSFLLARLWYCGLRHPEPT
ncbi:MAG: hypothetical protein ACREF5_00455 [Candidatus Saccharimonadales bacterium]